ALASPWPRPGLALASPSPRPRLAPARPGRRSDPNSSRMPADGAVRRSGYAVERCSAARRAGRSKASSEGKAVASVRDWVAGARPRTLPAAIVPVVVGSGVAAGYGRFSAWRAALALVVALALQVGVNFANDYSDGIRGTDERRGGPVRLVASGLV